MPRLFWNRERRRRRSGGIRRLQLCTNQRQPPTHYYLPRTYVRTNVEKREEGREGGKSLKQIPFKRGDQKEESPRHSDVRTLLEATHYGESSRYTAVDKYRNYESVWPGIYATIFFSREKIASCWFSSYYLLLWDVP